MQKVFYDQLSARLRANPSCSSHGTEPHTRLPFVHSPFIQEWERKSRLYNPDAALSLALQSLLETFSPSMPSSPRTLELNYRSN